MISTLSLSRGSKNKIMTNVAYTNGVIEGELQRDPVFTDMKNSSSKSDVFSPYSTSASDPTMWRLPWTDLPDIYSRHSSRDDFIGILSEEEAVEMERKLDVFKKRFDDDLTRRNKILFG